MEVMKTVKFSSSLLLCLFFLFAALPLRVMADPAPKGARDIYDESADGAKQVADALAIAKKENKRVLLQFGANWCGWCHRLHKLFDTDKAIAAKLQGDYVVVMVDVNKGHNEATDAKYGHPIQYGLPALAVLDAEGRLLTVQDSGKLEEGDHHSPEKVMAFLKEWGMKK